MIPGGGPAAEPDAGGQQARGLRTVLTYLRAMEAQSATDLYLTIGFPPMLRGDDATTRLSDTPLTRDDLDAIMAAVLTRRQLREFAVKMELNTALDMGKQGRFRVNVLRQRQQPALVIRRIITKIPDFAALRLPPIMAQLAMATNGLVLVTGRTGSGKSTTLAAMIDYRNDRVPGHIVTIEDPIEYYHEHKKCIVSQREVGVDTESFYEAMRNCLRQRPDVILVGEVRDRHSMEQALTISASGHLCLATLHTNNSYQAIERVINLFPEEHKDQIRLNLSLNLRAIVAQRLVPAVGGGVVPAVEVLLNQALVREIILKGELGKISSVMERNVSQGMCTFDQSLCDLFARGLVTEQAALTNADRPTDLKIKLEHIKMSGPGKGDILGTMDTSAFALADRE